MNFSSVNSLRLPGIRGFVQRSKVFRKTAPASAMTSIELIETARVEYEKGSLRPGEVFPSPQALSKLTGAPLASSLKAVTTLLQSGLIRQHPSGRLFVAKPPVS